MTTGIVRSDYVFIGGTRYPVANGRVIRHRLFPDGTFQVQRGQNQPQFGDLNPFVYPYTINKFDGGIGDYVDHDTSHHAGKVWSSTLNHSIPGIVQEPDYQVTITGLSGATIWKLIQFQGTVYAGTSIGLYTINLSTNAATAVAATPVDIIYDLCIHKGNLWCAFGAGTTVRYWSGAAWTTPANTINADRLCDLDTRLFGALPYSGANEGIQVQHTGDEGATAWAATIFYSNGTTQAAIPSPSGLGTSAFIAAPVDIADWKLYLATPGGVWEIDYTVGSYRLLIETSNQHLTNGHALHYWSTTGKLYVNQRNSYIAVNLATREAENIGPEFIGYEQGVLTGLPLNTGPNPASNGIAGIGMYSAASDANYLYVGTYGAATSTRRPTILKLTPDHRWLHEGTPAVELASGTTGLLVNPLHFAAILPLAITGDIPGGSDAVCQRLIFGGDAVGSDDCLAQIVRRGDTFSVHGAIGAQLLYCEFPWLTMGLPNTNKTIYTITVDCANIGANQAVQLHYKTDYADTTVPTPLTSMTSATTFPVVLSIASDAGVQYRAFKLLVTIDDTSGNSYGTSSPRFISAVLSWRPTPPARYAYEFDLLLDPELDREGRYTDLEATLDTALTGATTISFIPADDAGATAVRVVPIGGTSDGQASLLDDQHSRDVLPRMRLRLVQVI